MNMGAYFHVQVGGAQSRDRPSAGHVHGCTSIHAHGSRPRTLAQAQQPAGLHLTVL